MNQFDTTPSRASNPFATCWTRPGALPFVPTRQASIEECVSLLRQHHWRGQVVGPHGVGKSTLLRGIETAARESGLATVFVRAESLRRPRLRRGSRRAQSKPLFGSPPGGAGGYEGVVFLDGFEQLPLWQRWAWRRRPLGLVVTSHRPAGLPELARLAPTYADALQLFLHLCRQCPTDVSEEDLRLAYHRRRGNLREIWFDLYTRHEQLARDPANLSHPAT